jgi:hypothetical protein
MLTVTCVLSKSILYLLTVECSATADLWFSSPVCLFRYPGGDARSRLADVHLTTETGDLVNIRFFSQEFSVLGGFESGGYFVEWFLYGVDAVFFSNMDMLSVSLGYMVSVLCGLIFSYCFCFKSSLGFSVDVL